MENSRNLVEERGEKKSHRYRLIFHIVYRQLMTCGRRVAEHCEKCQTREYDTLLLNEWCFFLIIIIKLNAIEFFE